MTRVFVLLTAACLIVGCGSNHNMSAGLTTPLTPTPANDGNYELTGTVETMTPYGEAPLAGTRIDLSGGAGPRTAVTDSNGHYAVDALGPGRWTVNVTKSGFVPQTAQLDLSSDLRMNFQLERDDRDPRHGR